MSVAQNLANGNWDLQLSNRWADHLSHGDLIPIHLKDLKGVSLNSAGGPSGLFLFET